MAIEGALGPLFLLILLGAFLGWRRWPGEAFWPQLERGVYFLLFPAMLLATLATTDVSRLPVGRMAVALLFAALSTTTSANILARQLGGDAELMAALITAQTLLAMLTLPAWLALALAQ